MKRTKAKGAEKEIHSHMYVQCTMYRYGVNVNRSIIIDGRGKKNVEVNLRESELKPRQAASQESHRNKSTHFRSYKFSAQIIIA